MIQGFHRCWRLFLQITKQRSKGSFEFRYSIGLHKDDIAVLEYIKSNLQFGKVKLNAKYNSVAYNVIAKHEVAILIEIFSIFNLNSNKHLNFLAFKKAFFLYNSSSSQNRLELMAEIEKIKVGMNTKRTDFIMPKEHKVVITPYWLLEFIEGDGSFSFNSNLNRIMFSLSQKGFYY